MIRILRAFSVLFLFLNLSACQSEARPALLPLTIQNHAKTLHFSVEIARTEAEQERGLMFRKSLPKFGGMIFPIVPARTVSFWMKNTVIPLDMIFIRSDGSIARIAREAVPYSLDPVDSGEPVAAVLEIAGGQAAALGISEEDSVKWKAQ